MKRTILIALAALLLTAPAAEACTKEFVPATGAWTTAANWSPAGVPGAADDACIPAGRSATLASGAAPVRSVVADGLTLSGGTLTVTDASSVQALTLSSGTLGGVGALTVKDMTWSGGTMTDAGTTRITGKLVSEGSATVFVASGRRLENEGTIELRSARTISSSGTLGVLHNTGTVTATAAATISLPFENDGTVSGPVTLSGGDGPGTSSGTFTDTVFSAQTFELDGATLAGARIAGGAVDVPTTATATAATLAGGELGGTGTLTVTGTLNWTGGTMTDAGTTRVTGTLVSEGTATVFLASGRRLENAGAIELRSARTISSSGTLGVLHNTGTITATAATTVSSPLENDGTLSGPVTLSGGDGTGTSGGTFTDTVFSAQTYELADGAKVAGVGVAGGTVDVVAGATATGTGTLASGEIGGTGTLSVSDFTWTGGTMSDAGTTRVTGKLVSEGTGTVFVASARRLENTGTIELRSARTISSSGTLGVLRNTGTVTATAAATISLPFENDGTVSGPVTLSGGDGTGTSSGTFTDTVYTAGLYELDGATLTGARIAGGTVDAIPGGTATLSGTLASGEIGGTGTLVVSDLIWTGGTMSDPGTTRVATGGTLAREGTANVFLAAGRVLENAGTVDLRGDTPISGSGTLGRVHNTGTVKKSAGTGTARIAVPLANDGVVRSTSGRLEVEGPSAGVTHSGDFEGASETAPVVLRAGTGTLGAGAELDGFVELGGGTLAVAAGHTVAIEGRLTVSGGTLAGPGDVTVSGTLRWTGGTISGPGTLLITGKLDAAATNCSLTLRDGRVLDNRGTVQLLNGTAISTFGTPRPVIENAGTFKIDDTTPGTCSSTGVSGNVLLHNAGTLEKLGGDGAAQVGDTLDNDGQLVVMRGSLELASTSAVTHTGAFRGAVTFALGRFDLGTGATLAGSVTVEEADVNLPDGMTLTIAPGDVLRLLGGRLDGGDVVVRGTFAWEGGTRGGTGSTTVEAGAAVTVGVTTPNSFATAALDSGHTFVNRGDVEVRRTTWSLADGASLLNSGTVRLTGGGRISGDGLAGFGFGALVHNTGTVLKTGTDGAVLDVAVDNDGTVETQAGVLQFERLLNYSEAGGLTGGTWIVRSPGQLWVPGTLRTNAARIVLDGPGAGLRYEGDFTTPLRDAFDNFTRNAAGGRLEISGGDEVTVLGTLQNLGVLRIGAGSKLSLGGFRQTGANAVLRVGLASATSFGRLVTSGNAALAGRLDVERGAFTPSAGQEFPILSAGSVLGTFATVTDLGGGVALEPRYEAPGVKLRVPGGAGALAPAETKPVAVVRSVRLDDRALRVTSGRWARAGGFSVAARRGATLARGGVTARALALSARTCATCGVLEVRFAGTVARVSLRSPRPARKLLPVAALASARTGTVRLRTLSARRVAIDALVVMPS